MKKWPKFQDIGGLEEEKSKSFIKKWFWKLLTLLLNMILSSILCQLNSRKVFYYLDHPAAVRLFWHKQPLILLIYNSWSWKVPSCSINISGRVNRRWEICLTKHKLSRHVCFSSMSLMHLFQGGAKAQLT